MYVERMFKEIHAPFFHRQSESSQTELDTDSLGLCTLINESMFIYSSCFELLLLLKNNYHTIIIQHRLCENCV